MSFSSFSFANLARPNFDDPSSDHIQPSFTMPPHLQKVQQQVKICQQNSLLQEDSAQNISKKQSTAKSSKNDFHPIFDEQMQWNQDDSNSASDFSLNFKLPDPEDESIGGGLPESTASIEVVTKQKDVHLTESDWKFIKNSAWREDYLERMGINRTKSVLHKIVYLAFMSVDPGTFRSYASHWNKMKHARCAISRRGLMEYYAEHQASIKTDSLNSWESAVALYERAMGRDGPVALLKLVSNGYAADNPNGVANERGIIDRNKVHELATHKSIQDTEYALGFQLQFACGVRGGQIDGMRKDQFTRLVDKRTKKTMAFLYTCPKHKDKSKNRKKSVESHVCDPHYNELIEDLLKRAEENPRDHPQGRLLPSWKQTEANKLVKAAAADLNWDADFVWVNHGIRHGACQDAADDSDCDDEDEKAELAASRTCQSSKSVIKNTYLKSETERKASVQTSKNNKLLKANLPPETPADIETSSKKVQQQKKQNKKAKSSSPSTSTKDTRDPHTGKKKQVDRVNRLKNSTTTGAVLKNLKKNKNLKFVSC